MLPAENRLRGTRAHLRVQRSPTVVRTPRLTIRVVNRGDGGVPRIALAVGRRVSTRAVKRNKVRRWLREAIRRELPQIHAAVDLRVSATGSFPQYSFDQCVEDVSALCARARLFPRSSP